MQNIKNMQKIYKYMKGCIDKQTFKDFIKEYPNIISNEIINEIINDVINNSYIKQWNYKNYDCRVERKFGLIWCGYIDKLPNYIDESKINHNKINVHGGLTCGLGFDCGHYDDIVIGNLIMDHLMSCSLSFSRNHEKTYKNISFAIKETENMVDQIEKQYQLNKK